MNVIAQNYKLLYEKLNKNRLNTTDVRNPHHIIQLIRFTNCINSVIHLFCEQCSFVTMFYLNPNTTIPFVSFRN